MNCADVRYLWIGAGSLWIGAGSLWSGAVVALLWNKRVDETESCSPVFSHNCDFKRAFI